ncbi:hypothetical protein [Paracoccus sp. ME4]|uniref:hypothetical protein n=1 Tax=Paracoccus sp. ME4 TaxID=3138066 RepID=UPI00398B130A
MRSLALFILMTLGLSSASTAQEAVTVGANSRVKIDRHNVCRMVENLAQTPFMVATRDSSEWSIGSSSFLNVVPPDVRLSACRDNFCPIGSENFKKRAVFDITHPVFSIQDDFVVGNTGNRPFVTEGVYSIWTRDGAGWSKEREYPGITGYPRSSISGHGNRILVKDLASTDLSFFEIGRSGSTFSGAALKTVGNVPGGSVYALSEMNDDGDAVIAMQFELEGDAFEITRNADGSWSRKSVLPAPALSRRTLLNAQLFNDGSNAYLSGTFGPDSARRTWGSVYRKSGNSWSIVQNFRDDIPMVASRNGLFAYAVTGDGFVNTSTPGTLKVWSRDSVEQNFSELNTVTVPNSAGADYTKCCRGLPQPTYDGETVYVMTGSQWIGGGGVQAFRYNGTRFVNAGMAMVDEGESRQMQDEPSRHLFVSGSGKWFGVSQQSTGGDPHRKSLFGIGCGG